MSGRESRGAGPAAGSMPIVAPDPSGGRGDLGAWLAIGLVGLAVRLAFVLPFARHPIGEMPWVDEGAYWSRAREIRSGRWLPERPFYQDPLFPYGLAVLSGVVGAEVGRLRIAMACIGAMAPVMIYGAARRGLGRAEAVVAGLAAAVYGPLVFSDGLIEKEGPAALVCASALWLTARAASGGLIAAGTAGLAWGVMALLRSNALLIGPIGAAWMAAAAASAGNPAGRMRRAILASSFVAGFGLALAPVAAVNAFVGARPEFLLTTWQLGANFYIGNGPGANGTYQAPRFVTANPAREADDFAAEARRRTGRDLSPGEVSRFWLGQGLRRWREAPGASMSLLARKLGLVAHDREIPDSHDAEFVRIVAAPGLALAFLGFGWVSPWAAAGLGRANRSAFWWFLVLSTGAGLISTAAFFVVGRYRVPWAPGLLMLAAAGLVDLSRRLRAGDWRGLAGRLVFLIMPAAVLAWRPMSDPVPERWGHMLIGLGLADALAGRLDPAIDALDDARAMGRGPADRVEQLLADGPLRKALGALIDARPEGDRQPGAGAESDLRLARWMRQFPEGRARSRRLLDRRLADVPEDRRALRESGAWWLGAVDDPDGRAHAAAEFLRAATGPDGDPSAAVLLALLVRDPLALPASAPALDPGRRQLSRAILAAGGPTSH